MLLRFGTLQNNLSETILREEQLNAQLHQLSLLEATMQHDMLLFRYDPNPQYLESIAATDATIRALITTFQNNITREKAIALLETFKRDRARRTEIHGTLISAIQGDNEEETDRLFRQWAEYFDRTNATLVELTTFKKELLESVIADAKETNERMHRLLLGLLALSFALMFIASAYHNISIIRPLMHLRRHAEQITHGDLDPQVHWRIDDDEIGHLTNSLRDMTAKLRQSHTALEERVQERTRELRVAKERIEEEASNVRKFQQAVESAFDAVFMTTDSPSIVYVNPSWERLMGYTKEDALGKNPWVFLSVETEPRVRTELERTIETGQPYFTEEIIARRKNGTEFDMELTLYPLKDSDGRTFLVGVAHDITRRRKLEQAKTDFVSLASHQLRTPLTGIRWALGRLHKSRELLPSQQQEMLIAARNATARMAETIDTMLTISRIEAERIELKPWDLRLGIFLRNSIHECEHLYKAKRQTVTLLCTEDVRLRTDPNVLHEIVTNLLTNAIKYTPERGRITLRAEYDTNDHIRLEIQDTGYGIPSDQQHKVFSKFFRGNNVIENDPDGTGLGLYLVYALVRLIGGSISFVSEENCGTTFTILLPLTLPFYGQIGIGR